MTINRNNRKQLIDFLIRRWRLIISFAASERVVTAMSKFAKDNNMPLPKECHIVIPHACRQIEIIKQRIIETLPEAKFIDYDYEAPAPLDPNDFVEVFIADHCQCIAKVEEVIKRMQIK